MRDSPRQRRRGDLAPNPEMVQALEGDKLNAILEDFYGRVYKDPRLVHFFADVTMDRAIQKQHSFLTSKFTGKNLYFGDRPRNAHHWMVISDELFDYREELMMQCLRRAELPEHLIEAWRALEEAFRTHIVKAEPIARKIQGFALPLDGYEPITLSVGALCDGCEGPIEADSSGYYHRRTGKTFCNTCMPRV